MSYKLALVATLMSSAAYAGTTDTDNFGNTITGSDSNDAVMSDLFFDISGFAPQLTIGDDVAATEVDLGFGFSFYGEEYTQVAAITNGFISFNPTDSGGDYTNDATLPTNPSTGSGPRIYAHHDDTEAAIYGAFIEASENPLGVDAFVFQIDGCHYPCNPAIDTTVQYNVALLADGTVVMAHNLAGPEQGAGATVGIQNGAVDDGVAYSANEGSSIVDGQTVIVIPPESGLSTDIRNIAAEAGVTEAAALAANVAAQLAQGGSSNLATQSATNPASRGFSDVTSRYQPWVTAGALYTKTETDGSLESNSLFVQGGIDLIKTDRWLAGIGLAFSRGESTLSGASANIGSETIFAYAGTQLAGWDLGGTVSFGKTHYEDFDTSIMGGMDADGQRTTVSVSATKDFAVGSAMTLAPRLSLLAGQEKMDDWSAGAGMSRSIDDVSFYKAEVSGKLSRGIGAFGNGGTGYLLAGVDYLSIDGDSDIALFSAGYENDRVGGVAGIGLDGVEVGGMALSADLTATGITDDGYTLRGAFTLEF